LVALLARHRFLAVVGVSGSGKSSPVKAGLPPALHLGAMGEEFLD
jgi:excinuclease UvrABC ATPase subunit